jgi:hypothetical protein
MYAQTADESRSCDSEGGAPRSPRGAHPAFGALQTDPPTIAARPGEVLARARAGGDVNRYIAKRNGRKKYESGKNVSVAAPSKGGWMLEAMCVSGNPYDNRT